MPASEPRADARTTRPAGALRGLVRAYHGYHYRGFPSGVHRGLPSPDLTVVLALGPPTRMTTMPDPRDAPRSFRALASGLATRAVGIGHDGEQYGVQLDLTPLGARRLLGVPAGELASTVVDLDALLGREADDLLERLAEAPSWTQRFTVLDAVLGTRAVRRSGSPAAEAPPALEHAWRTLVGSGGDVRIGELAARTGWSRRHLTERFAREYGLAPKQLARVVRFGRSRQALRAGARHLGDVAATCGYADQSHLAREWVALAGCPPSRWLREEQLPIVQDEPTEAGAP